MTSIVGDGEYEAVHAPIANPPRRWQKSLVPNRSLKWLIPVLGPVLVMLLLGFLIWNSGRSKPETKVPETPSRSTRVEMNQLSPGGTVPEWAGSQGTFKLVEKDGKTVLELGYEPLVEGRMIWNRLLGKSGVIRARIWGERTRRNAPRFALGVGKNSNYWFRVVPLERKLQIVGKEEKELASAAWEGDPEKPLWLELEFAATGREGESRLEGRVWAEGATRPEEASLVADVPEEFGFGRAVVAGAPYALKPIYIDLIEVSPGSAAEK